MCLLFSAASEGRIRNLGLEVKIWTFLGPFWHFGPIWDQVPNSGPYCSACLLNSRNRKSNLLLFTTSNDDFDDGGWWFYHIMMMMIVQQCSKTGGTSEASTGLGCSWDTSRVAKCHGYGGYIRVKKLEGWGKKSVRTHSFAKSSIVFGKF